MPIQRVPETDLTYYLACFDKDGQERRGDPDGRMSDRIVDTIRDEPITDVFVVSHGWKGDIPAAISQYDSWIGAMAKCAADREEIRRLRPGFKALIIGFHWPNQPWGDEEFTGGASFSVTSTGTEHPEHSEHPLIARLVDLYADRLADTPAARAALRTIVSSALTAGPGTQTLPADVADAYRVLDAEAGLAAKGPAGGPGSDREPFDPEERYQEERRAAKMPDAPSFGGLRSKLDPAGLLSPLRQLSFWLATTMQPKL